MSISPKRLRQLARTKVVKFSTAQRAWLDALLEGRDPMSNLHGRSAHGGAVATRASLVRGGWITAGGELTHTARTLLSWKPGTSGEGNK